MTRAEKVARIREYVAAGYTHAGIAVEMGLSRSAVRNLLNDPDGSKQKARRARYQGTCETCGKKTDGSNGRAKAPRFCAICIVGTPDYNAHLMRWPRELLIARIQEWAAINGEPPAVPDWNPCKALANHDVARAERFNADTYWPWFTTVVNRFGSWNAAIEAAGFTPRLSGGGGGNHLRRRDQRAKRQQQVAA